MRKIDSKVIGDNLYKLILNSLKRLTPSAKTAIKNAEKDETNALSKFALNCVLENESIAMERDLPLCQDTGLAVVFLEIGQNVLIEGNYIIDEINDAVRRAYKDGFFRKSCCDPLTRENTKDNTPAIIHTEIVKGENIKITFMPKGFGSENMSKLYMLTPADGVDGIIDAIVNTVKVAGSKPCPPVYVGVGIGGTFDECALLAKKALLRPVGEKSLRKDVRAIEETALKKINELDIGAQGFGGKTTALSVSIIVKPTHIAGLPVAVNIQCHCIRGESITL